MASLYSIDSPFLILVVLFQLFFALITLVITYMSFRIYNLAKHKDSRFMGIAFCLISGSYFVQVLFNILALMQIKHDQYVFMGIHPLSVFNNLGLFFHVLLMTFGITFLLYITFRNKSKKLLLVLLFPTILVILLSRHLLFGFFLITTFYMFFVAHHFFLNYRQRKSIKPLLITIAFFFILIGQAEFVIMGQNPVIYLVAHFFNFLAYTLILANLYLITKK